MRYFEIIIMMLLPFLATSQQIHKDQQSKTRSNIISFDKNVFGENVVINRTIKPIAIIKMYHLRFDAAIYYDMVNKKYQKYVRLIQLPSFSKQLQMASDILNGYDVENYVNAIEYIDEQEIDKLIVLFEKLKEICKQNPEDFQEQDFYYYTDNNIYIDCYTTKTKWKIAIIFIDYLASEDGGKAIINPQDIDDIITIFKRAKEIFAKYQ